MSSQGSAGSETREAGSAPRVAVFFYGSFINRRVLIEGGLVPEVIEVARLRGWELTIRPLANIVPAETGLVYGIVCRATHEELARLYGQDWVGAYLPQAAIVEIAQDGRLTPALVYVDPALREAPAAGDYVDRILVPARELGFPDWYLALIESFRPLA